MKKMMKTLYNILGIWMMVCLVSCSEKELSDSQLQGGLITATAVSSEDNAVFTRLGFEDKKDNDGGVGITWAMGDGFYMTGLNNGAYAEMTLSEGEEGKKIAHFTGTLNGDLAEGDEIAAYYPVGAYDSENDRFNVDLRNVTQDCSAGNEMSHLSETYYMVGQGEVNLLGKVDVSFVNGTKVAMLRFDLTLPAQTKSGLTIDELLIACEDLNTVGTLLPDGTFAPTAAMESHRQRVKLTNLAASTGEETQFSVYVNVLPVTLNHKMRLKAKLSDETVYWCDVEFNNVKLEANNRYYVVRAFLEEQKVGVDYSWYDANGKNLTISNEAQLRAFANIVNKKSSMSLDRFYEQTITLQADIDLIVDWIPVGYSASGTTGCYFRGTFDGNNKTISGLYFDDECHEVYQMTGAQTYGNSAGLFGWTSGATVKNLTVKGKIKSGYRYVGGIVGLNNTESSGTTVIQNCVNEVDIEQTYNGGASSLVSAGGIIGWANKVNIIECSNLGKIENTKLVSNGGVGGITGVCNNDNTVIIIACVNKGIVNASTGGGILGNMYNNTIRATILACVNLANPLSDLTSISKTAFGGIIGRTCKVKMYGCYTLDADIYGLEDGSPSINDSSCLVLTPEEMNSQAKADALNAGIVEWNEANASSPCNYHFEVGQQEGHLIIVTGAPESVSQEVVE